MVVVRFRMLFKCVWFGCSDWERVEEDSRKAIQLDSNSVKVFVTNLLVIL